MTARAESGIIKIKGKSQFIVKQEVVVSMLKRSLIGTIILFFLTFLIPAGCARRSKLPPVRKTALG